jgi:hypothetical protein
LKQKKTEKTEETETVMPAIDPDVMARINAKIARAHEQNETPYVYHKQKAPAAKIPKTDL